MKKDISSVDKFLENSLAEKNIENFNVYLLIGSDERGANSSASEGMLKEKEQVIILGLINNINDEKFLIIPRDVLISNPCTKKIVRINSTFNNNNCGNRQKTLQLR